MKRLLGGMRTVARAVRRHKIVAAVSVLALGGIVTFTLPYAADAAPNPAPATMKWLNRSYLVGSDNKNYYDGNTFDNIFEYVEQGRPSCPNKLTFSHAGTPNNFIQAAFFYNDGIYTGQFTPKLFVGEPFTQGNGQAGCNYSERTVPIDNNSSARRITWFRDTRGGQDKITNILSGVMFSRRGDFKGAARFFRDSEVADANNSCADMILQHATRPMSEAMWGNRNEVPGSSILFSVERNSDLGRVAETYDIDTEPNSINRSDCRVRSDALFQTRSGEYAQMRGEGNNTDVLFMASGLDENGQTRSSGDYEDDAFITFVGTLDNMPKDSSNNPITNPTGPGGSQPDRIDEQICRGGALGWVICPMVSAIQTAANAFRDVLQYFLTVNALPVGSGPIYDSWNNIRNLANISFALVFFAIIFSQATSIGISNYGVKRLLPRLVIIAIATNLSYYFSSLMIDVFNILGVGITSLFAVVNGGALGTITVENGAGAIFTGGLIAGLGWAFASGSIVYIFPLIAASFLAVLVIFLVLVVRQALLILLVIFSPLAFVAGLLPGTQNLFSGWMNLFLALLAMYPITMAIFAGVRMAASILSTVTGG